MPSPAGTAGWFASFLQPSLRDLLRYPPNPALKRWAIVTQSLRDLILLQNLNFLCVFAPWREPQNSGNGRKTVAASVGKSAGTGKVTGCFASHCNARTMTV